MTSVDRWKNRRRMAWLALIAGLLFPLLLLWSDSDQLGSVAGAFYVFVTGVLGAYFGFATWDDVSHGKNTNDEVTVLKTDWPVKE